MSPEWIWIIFIFAFGACVGSFLNVVVYRLPRDKSLVYPPSACPKCDRPIRFYDNIPLLSWLVLGAKCRNCKAPISARYFVIELFTALVFTGFYLWVFVFEKRRLGIEASAGLEQFLHGGWLFYLVNITLLCGLIAASAIDLELWVIPLSICWFITAAGLLVSTGAPFVIEPPIIWSYKLFPAATAVPGILAAGACIGLFIALFLLWKGIIKPSYFEESANGENPSEAGNSEQNFNDRFEILKEVVFVSPIVLCSFAAYLLYRVPFFARWWADFSQIPVITGLLGALWGYFIGGAIVWATRIFGTLAFGKEAMGLGDVHLMAAAGTVVGPLLITLAFFIAPFFGLAWAGYQMCLRKTRQIPYGPFLSLGIVVVIIFHDRIADRIGWLYIVN